MTGETAKARLTEMVAATTEPVLTTTDGGDVEQLLAMFVVAEPSSEGASDGVWSLNRAAAEGWRRRAGRVMDDNNYIQDARGVAKNQMFKDSLEMARYYDELADAAGEPLPDDFTEASEMETFCIEVGCC